MLNVKNPQTKVRGVFWFLSMLKICFFVNSLILFVRLQDFSNLDSTQESGILDEERTNLDILK